MKKNIKEKKEYMDSNKQIVLMLGYLCISTESESSLIRKVEILDRFGLKDADIALICGRKEQGIRDARQKAKKK